MNVNSASQAIGIDDVDLDILDFGNDVKAHVPFMRSGVVRK